MRFSLELPDRDQKLKVLQCFINSGEPLVIDSCSLAIIFTHHISEMNLKAMFFLIPLFSLLLASCQSKKENHAPADASVTNMPAPATSPSSTKALPDFQMVDAGGNLVSLSSFKGKKVFVNIWASWCPPCKREMPSIEKLYKASDTAKASFVLLSVDNHFEVARRYMKAAKLDLPLFYPAQDLPPLFSVESIPATFIFDESGNLVRRVDGAENYNTAEYKKMFR